MLGFKSIVAIGFIALFSAGVNASEEVKFAGFYVEPYYSGPKKEGDPAQKVNVLKEIDNKLKSKSKKDVLEARDKIQASAATVSPMTLFVLAARLYDVNERDEAVFWYYNALFRSRLVSYVLDKATLVQENTANRSFQSLLGPMINGYAFCDIKKQKEQELKSLKWGEQNKYQVLFNKSIPSRFEDRKKGAEQFITEYSAHIKNSLSTLDDEKARKDFVESRKKNNLDAKYCWN